MKEPILKDLQSILRSQLGDELIVENYVTKDLLPPGKNYGSSIKGVHAVIKRGLNEKSGDLYLVAKLPPPTVFQRELFDSPYTFPKEIFMYSDILPFYRRLEIENGIEENEALDISPHYYGSRLSLNPDKNFDDDAVILLENLKPRGYYCIERRIGCDWPHARLAVESLARFHALGMAVKEKHPKFFEILKLRSKDMDSKFEEGAAEMLEQRLKDVGDDPDISRHLEACARIVRAYDESQWRGVPSEPWSTIIHSDFWVNNILFYRENDASGPTDIKFIDYQNYLFLSPMRDLIFFLAGGLKHELINKVDDLIKLYYDTIIERLRILNCNIEPYSLETFYKKVKEDAGIVLAHCLFMVKIFTMDIDGDDPEGGDVKNLIENDARGEAYKTRLKDLITIYHNQGWLIH